jgi:hypothetical protein
MFLLKVGAKTSRESHGGVIAQGLSLDRLTLLKLNHNHPVLRLLVANNNNSSNNKECKACREDKGKDKARTRTGAKT